MAKKGGIADVAKGRSDTYRLSPTDLHVKEGWNCRELDTPEAQQELWELAQSIKEIGVKQALTVFWEDGKAYITDGHRRRLAALMAMEDNPDLVVPVITEARNSTEAERVFSQIIRNSGKPFTPLEQGEVFNRLVDLGWSDADIASRAGISRVHVANLRALIAAPKTLTNLVRSGAVSSTLAITTLRKHNGNAKAAAADLKGAVKEAKKAGKERATAKDMRKTKAKDAPEPKKRVDPNSELRAILTEFPVTFPDSLTVPNQDDVHLIPLTAAGWKRVREILGIAEPKRRDSDLV